MESEPESWQVRGKKFARSILFLYVVFFLFVLAYGVTETLIRDLGAPAAGLVLSTGAALAALGGLWGAHPGRASRLPMLAIGGGALVAAAAGLAQALTR